MESETEGDRMTLDDVPADVIMILTVELDRLFKFAQCVPTCHVCKNKIEVGDDFQLISISPRDRAMPRAYLDPDGPPMDEMACGSCTREDLNKAHETYVEALRPIGGGYSRPSRVKEN